MRRTVIALMALTALVAGCDRPAEAPVDAPAAEAPAPEMPADAPPQEEVDPETGSLRTRYLSGEDVSEPCATVLGAVEAQALVARCIAVSPATHPPCNVANACGMIQGEIDRSCELYAPGEAKPAECTA